MEPTSPRWWPFSADPHHRARRIRRWVIGILIALGVNWWLAHQATEGPSRLRVPYSPLFIDAVRAGDVSEVTSRGTTIQGSFKKPVVFEGSNPSRRFKTEIPAFADGPALTRLLQQHRVTVNAEPLDESLPWWKSLLFGFGPTLLLLGLLYWVFKRSRGGTGGLLGSLGRAKPRRFDPAAGTVRFADVAGIDEAKVELTEIVDFLRDPEKYGRLGGRIPRGVLLSGGPGTGKTLLARAVAGEAGVPFFSMSASEFVEAIAGLGASRVRDLFAQAKKVAPAIVFIDELDAVGRARSAHSGFGASSDEREQTLNQILTELDGFEGDTSVIVMAATNRPDILDAALLRPGRFDRRIAVQPPDREGREKILEVHTRGIPLDGGVDVGRLAASTPGMVGADLANLVNEAALLAARRNHEQVTAADFTDALERVILGAERQIVMSDADRRRTAYHEAGHALVGMLSVGSDPVRKISIIPRGVSLGVTLSTPDADRFNYTEQELRSRIVLALGGRAAEEIIFGDRTTGVESDVRQATEIARLMVGNWAMSDTIGILALAQERDGDGRGWVHSQHTQEQADEEVRRLIADSYGQALDLLQQNRRSLESLVQALLEHETLDEEAAYEAAGVARRRPPDA